LYGLAERAHLASQLALQPPDDGAFAFDDFAHALELTGVGVTTNLLVLQLALFGVGLLALDAIGLSRPDHLGPGRLQPLNRVTGVLQGQLTQAHREGY
jgi:hypothetical protein